LWQLLLPEQLEHTEPAEPQAVSSLPVRQTPE